MLNSHYHHSAQKDEALVFAEEDNEFILAKGKEHSKKQEKKSWKVLIVDDEVEVHKVTKLALRNFTFKKKSLNFISAYSGQEAKNLIKAHSDIAIVLLDVIMESEDSGLGLVKYIREELHNHLVRIILRTGQPGKVPESIVIRNYDIDDYKVKTELTQQKLSTTVTTGLRSFHALTKTVEASKLELAKIAAAAERFVPREFLNFLHKKSIVDTKLGDSVQADMTIMFADIRSFTSLSETMSPQENFKFINSYLSRVGPVIREYHGFIDKYIGDALMALFPNTTDDAIQAAIEMQRQVTIYNQHRNDDGYVPISIGIGLHTGTLMLGTVGEKERMQSTVISDAVNLASRMEDLTKVYGVKIIISMKTFSEIQNVQRYNCRFLGRIKVRGKQYPVAIFEIYDSDPPHILKMKRTTKTQFERAIILYYQKRYTEAQLIFQQILSLNQEDKVARLYKERCEQGLPLEAF